MNIDISKLSIEELYKLNKDVQKEIGKRNVLTKQTCGVPEQIYYLFHDEIIKEVVDLKVINMDDTNFSVWGSVLEPLERSVFKICDLTLKNYRWKIRTDKFGKNMPTLFSNGSVVIVDNKKYQNMCDDILNIIKKYKEIKNETD